MRLARIFIIAVLWVLGTASFTSAQRITYAGGKGVFGNGVCDSVWAWQSVVIYLRFENPGTSDLSISNGFEIYSPNGATWSGPIGIDTLCGAIPSTCWDVGFSTFTFVGTDGRDTVGLVGQKDVACGLPAGFNGVPYGIKVGQFDLDDLDLVFCIDSAWFRPAGQWQWSSPQSGPVRPAWGGPYCWPIIPKPNAVTADRKPPSLLCNPCCRECTGNVDGDAEDIVDISDLSALVGFLFAGGSISDCPGENNVDASVDGTVDVSDLSLLVDFLFWSPWSLPFCSW
jgi:hypothetical protein